MSMSRLYPQVDSVWGKAACAGCGARLSVWADTLKGCCALCGHNFPEEFRWLHEKALVERQQVIERAKQDAAQWPLRAHEAELHRLRQSSMAWELSQYIQNRPG